MRRNHLLWLTLSHFTVGVVVWIVSTSSAAFATGNRSDRSDLGRVSTVVGTGTVQIAPVPGFTPPSDPWGTWTPVVITSEGKQLQLTPAPSDWSQAVIFLDGGRTVLHVAKPAQP